MGDAQRRPGVRNGSAQSPRRAFDVSTVRVRTLWRDPVYPFAMPGADELALLGAKITLRERDVRSNRKFECVTDDGSRLHGPPKRARDDALDETGALEAVRRIFGLAKTGFVKRNARRSLCPALEIPVCLTVP